jgi:alkylhydroperoxidase/carboxymuconolactone decarboxylase family protein YurZ
MQKRKMIMQNRYAIQVKKLLNAVLTNPGVIDTTTREAIEIFSAAQSDRIYVPIGEIPASLQAYLEKLVRHAYKVTGEDIQSLLQAGYSEEEIFEITVSAALGAGMGRLERGLAALQEGRE